MRQKDGLRIAQISSYVSPDHGHFSLRRKVMSDRSYLRAAAVVESVPQSMERLQTSRSTVNPGLAGAKISGQEFAGSTGCNYLMSHPKMWVIQRLSHIAHLPLRGCIDL